MRVYIGGMNTTNARSIGIVANRARAADRGASSTIRHGWGMTPVGRVLVGSTERGICALYLVDGDDPEAGLDRLRRDFPGEELVADASLAEKVVARVVAFLVSGRSCEDLALDLRGTPFQLRVWEALRTIPHGTTTSYGAIAERIGLTSGASRAVGTACGANPVCLLVPCHRVVRRGGALGGYEGGLDRKRALLELEGAGVLSGRDQASPSRLSAVS
ncbi:MAG: hypothetical protein NVSMB9_16030 [Isosphaeraceae bacterium]